MAKAPPGVGIVALSTNETFHVEHTPTTTEPRAIFAMENIVLSLTNTTWSDNAMPLAYWLRARAARHPSRPFQRPTFPDRHRASLAKVERSALCQTISLLV